jgi:phage shock protein C
MESKRFLRSKTERVFAGVCGGLAEYFQIDPILIRLLFVVLALVGGGGVLIYVILWIVAPEKVSVYTNTQDAPTDQGYSPPPPPPEPKPAYENPLASPASPPLVKRRRPHRGLIGGLVLITLGVLFLIDEFVPGIDFGDLWPVLLVVIGIGLLINGVSGRKEKN